MTQLVYSRTVAPLPLIFQQLKDIFRATPLAIFAAALQARR